MDKQPRPAADPGTPPATSPPPAPTAPTNERVTTTTAPKPRHDVGLSWLVLIGLLVLGSLPLLVDLSTPAVWSRQEALSVAISSETKQRKAPIADGETSMQSWTPVYQGESRWDLPPGGTWLHQVMYLGLEADGNTVDTTDNKAWITRARMGSVVMALLFIAAVFWAGHSLGGVTTGAISAMVAMTMPLLLGFGRHANPHIVAITWSTLSIAGALWAMRPLRAAPSLARQLIGWIVCGAGLGLAALTAGPTAIPGTLLCTVVLAMFCPRRIGHIMGLLASTALAVLLITPWALHVHDHDADVWQQWVRQLSPDFAQATLGETLQRASWRLSLAATFSGLWLIWLIPAVTQPFSTSTGKARRKMLIGWGWLITASALLAFAPGPTRISGLLLAVAPASVSIALTIQQFHDLSAEARHARLWLICRWITCGFMLAFAIALPIIGYLLNNRPDLVSWLPSYDHALLAPMHWSFYAGTGIALLLASVLAFRFAHANHPGRTTACLALWLLILACLAAIPISRGERLNTTFNAPDAERHSTDL